MKYWLEGQMTLDDDAKACSECGRTIRTPYSGEPGEIVFCEFKIYSGSMPNPQELHPEPTGLFLCQKCGKFKLV